MRGRWGRKFELAAAVFFVVEGACAVGSFGAGKQWLLGREPWPGVCYKQFEVPCKGQGTSWVLAEVTRSHGYLTSAIAVTRDSPGCLLVLFLKDIVLQQAAA